MTGDQISGGLFGFGIKRMFKRDKDIADLSALGAVDVVMG
jgi:hypothetical protein